MTTRRELLLTGLCIGAAGVITGLPGRALAQSGAYQPIAVNAGGAIEGVVRLKGKTPEPDRIIIGKDNHVCGEGHAAVDPVVLGPDGALLNAVVAIKDIKAGRPWAKRGAYQIVQERCAFHPHVQIAPRDIELTIHNKDPLLHNIHAYETIGRARRTLFNIAQPQAGQVDKHRLELRRGHIVEIDCDAHNWMSAWIFTSEHPYLAVTGAPGHFALSDVPPGTYEVSAWHPALGTVAAQASVKANSKTTIDIAFGA